MLKSPQRDTRVLSYSRLFRACRLLESGQRHHVLSSLKLKRQQILVCIARPMSHIACIHEAGKQQAYNIVCFQMWGNFRLIHLPNKLVDILFPVALVATLNVVLELACAPATSGVRELEGPEEVGSLPWLKCLQLPSTNRNNTPV